jgi:hypothetical protein
MWTRARFNNEYVPGLFALAIDSYVTNRAKNMGRQMCTVKTSKKKKEENAVRSGLGLPVLKGEGAPVNYDTQIAGAKQAWVHLVYALAVRITEEAIDDNLYELNGGGGGDELKEIFTDLGDSMAENEEVLLARFLNSGTATTYHTTRQGAYGLYNAAHPRLDGSTFANYTAAYADLTYLAFWAVVVAAENQFNHRQFKIKKRVQKLWIPPQLERQARECLYSKDRPDVANRAISAYAQSGRNIQLMNWTHITDTDSWHLQLDGDGIIFFDRRKTRFARDKDFQTGDMMCKADQRWSSEINDERCWYGVVP